MSTFDTTNSDWAWYGMAFLAVGVIGCGLIALKALGTELVYLVGYQGMHGAKVLDEQPYYSPLDDIEEQRVHGDAQFADRDDALAQLNEGGAR